MPPVEVSIAVVRDTQDRFLVGCRPRQVVLAGFHEFPGGKLRPGEDAATAAARECLEETGLVVTAGECLMRVEHDYEHARVRLEFYACEPHDVTVEPLPPYEWISRKGLSACTFPDANAGLIEGLVGGLFGCVNDEREP